jgi:sirohydrochlorin ferrochelatase
VQEAVVEAGLDFPTEIAFGMGMEPEEVGRVQEAVGRLTARGVREILAVPFLISTYSSVYRQYEYLLRIRREPSWPDHPVRPVELTIPVRLVQALDDSPWMGEILLERALALSEEPSEEAVVLVAHGPEEEADNASWMEAMQRLGADLLVRGGFAAFRAATLRDDADPAVEEQAARRLREEVSSLSGSLRVLVVPLLISRGGIEEKIPECLKGLSYRFSGQGLLPHPYAARWIRERVESAFPEAAAGGLT